MGGAERELAPRGAITIQLCRYSGGGTQPPFTLNAIAEFTLAAIPQPHDPQAPLMRVRSRLATANPTVTAATAEQQEE